MKLKQRKKHAIEETQCDILRRNLKSKSNLNTLEIRQRLGIMHPAGCVSRLRKNGYEIIAHRKAAYDARGRLHSGVAHYFLLSGRQHNYGGKYAK